jgi:hypothetical protein
MYKPLRNFTSGHKTLAKKCYLSTVSLPRNIRTKKCKMSKSCRRKCVKSIVYFVCVDLIGHLLDYRRKIPPVSLFFLKDTASFPRKHIYSKQILFRSSHVPSRSNLGDVTKTNTFSTRKRSVSVISFMTAAEVPSGKSRSKMAPCERPTCTTIITYYSAVAHIVSIRLLLFFFFFGSLTVGLRWLEWRLFLC